MLALLQHSLATAHPLDGGLASTLAAVSGARFHPPTASTSRPSSTATTTPHLYAADEAGMLHLLRHPRAIDLVARLYAGAAVPGGGGKQRAAAKAAGGGGAPPLPPLLPPHAHIMAALATAGRLPFDVAVTAAAGRMAEERGGGGGRSNPKPTPADTAAVRSAFGDLAAARLVERAPPPCLPPPRPLASVAAGQDGSGADPAVDAAVCAYGRARFALSAGDDTSPAGQASPPVSKSPPSAGRKRGRGGADAVPGQAAPPTATTALPPLAGEDDELLLWGGTPALWRPARSTLNRRLRAEGMVAAIADRRGPATAAVLGGLFEVAMSRADPAGAVAEGDDGGVARPGAAPPGPPYPPLCQAALEAALVPHRAALDAAVATGLLTPDDAEDLVPPANDAIDVGACLIALAEEGAVRVASDDDGASTGRPALTLHLQAGTLLAAARAREVEAVVRTRFGPEGVRIVRLLRSAQQLEQKAVGEAAMLPAKHARTLLYRLLKGGAVCLQDIPRAADRAPSRSFYTWRVDERGAAARVAAEALAAAGNALARLVHEADAARVGEAAAALALSPGVAAGGGAPATLPPSRVAPPPLSEERAARLRAYSAHRRLMWARILALDGLVGLMMDG